MKLKIHKMMAKHISYGKRRSRKGIKYIVIHYTGVNGDTAKDEAKYFAEINTRAAGAHFFVGQRGIVYKSIPMNRTAWSVGGFYTQKDGAGKYYEKCTNQNSVSIELCDNQKRDPSKLQTIAVAQLVDYIRRYCPNAKTIIRHWDVNGKECPARMTGTKNPKWLEFRERISGNV